MTTATISTGRTARDALGPVRRVAAIARYELLLLLRNKVMLMNALIITPGIVIMFLALIDIELTPAAAVAMTASWGLMFVIYLNLTSIFVSRREDRVFARMETGEASKWEGLIAAAIPSTVIMAIQLVLAGVLGSIAYDGPLLSRPVEAVVGLLLALVTFVGLAAATTAITKSVEAAQITTMPVLIAMIFFSGASFPLVFLPEVLQRLAAATPLNALTALIVPGAEADLLPSGPLGILALWAVLAVVLARRYTAFAPRR